MAMVLEEINLAVQELRLSDDLRSLNQSIRRLCEIAKTETNVDQIIKTGAVTALVRRLKERLQLDPTQTAYLLGLLADEPGHQMIVYNADTLPILVAMLHKDQQSSVITKAVYAINRILHQIPLHKQAFSLASGIPALISILYSKDTKVLLDAGRALRILAKDDNPIKEEIIDSDALPPLVLMLQSEIPAINYEAVRVIDTLTKTSPQQLIINVFDFALQPVIDLLRSTQMETQTLAAFLLARYAGAYPLGKAHIVQRGALGPLIEMLQSTDERLKEASSLAVGRLADDHDCHNQVGIAHAGGIPALLNLLNLDNNTLQHHAAFAFKGLASSKDLVPDFIRAGVVQKLLSSHYVYQPTRKCVEDTLAKLEEWVQSIMVMRRLLSVFRASDSTSKQMILFALARMCSPEHQKEIFIDNNGLALLVALLKSGDPNIRISACASLCSMYERAGELSSMVVKGSIPPNLKSLCEEQLVQDISDDTLLSMFDISLKLNAVKMREACVLYALRTCRTLNREPWFQSLMIKMHPFIEEMFVKTLLEADKGVANG